MADCGFCDGSAGLECAPTGKPSPSPSATPSRVPTPRPSERPTLVPTHDPTRVPTSLPTIRPTVMPSPLPTALPSDVPTSLPKPEPTPCPSYAPSEFAERPTGRPSAPPTWVPLPRPSSSPTYAPTTRPTPEPTRAPTTASPSASLAPTHEFAPTVDPSAAPTSPRPTRDPTPDPTPLTPFPTTHEPTSSPSCAVVDAGDAFTFCDEPEAAGWGVVAGVMAFGRGNSTCLMESENRHLNVFGSNDTYLGSALDVAATVAAARDTFVAFRVRAWGWKTQWGVSAEALSDGYTCAATVSASKTATLELVEWGTDGGDALATAAPLDLESDGSYVLSARAVGTELFCGLASGGVETHVDAISATWDRGKVGVGATGGGRYWSAFAANGVRADGPTASPTAVRKCGPSPQPTTATPTHSAPTYAPSHAPSVEKTYAPSPAPSEMPLPRPSDAPRAAGAASFFFLFFEVSS